MTEIELGIIRDSTRTELLNIIDRIRSDNPIEGVILGCTELPGIIRPSDIELAYINTTQIHINSAIERIKSTAI